MEGGKSLLPVGVAEVEGEFEAGDMVSVVAETNGRRVEIARGLGQLCLGRPEKDSPLQVEGYHTATRPSRFRRSDSPG